MAQSVLWVMGAFGAVCFAPLTSAQSANTNVGIVTNVIANCISTSSPIAFGSYNPFDAQPLTAAGALVLTCTQDATPSVAISLGANPSGGTRRMTAGAGNYLPYSILVPTSAAPNASCAGANTDYPVAAPGFTLTPAPSFAPRTFTVCGQIASGISAPVGNYSDTVLATISF
jgi:spore coat protein U-like protein